MRREKCSKINGHSYYTNINVKRDEKKRGKIGIAGVSGSGIKRFDRWTHLVSARFFDRLGITPGVALLFKILAVFHVPEGVLMLGYS